MQNYYPNPNDPSFHSYSGGHYGAPTSGHVPGTGTGTGFSEGSPSTGYPDQIHEPYFFDFSSSSLPAHATGLSEPGNLSRAQINVYSSEEVQSNWNYPSSHARPDLSLKTVSNPNSSYSPATATLPTPSEMAVLLMPDSGPAPTMPSIPPIPLAMVSAESSSLPPEEEYTLARERKHACSMCHKRFV